MSYTALYRKFRPQEFEDVKGQDHIVTTLKNQIKADRIGHAYLFCGTRGTGKTTVAKIFAKAVNCEHPVDGSPCGECPSCKGIAAGTSMNVIEIDSASTNSESQQASESQQPSENSQTSEQNTQQTAPSTTAVNSQTDWKSMNVVIDGRELTLPFDYSKISDIFTMNLAD